MSAGKVVHEFNAIDGSQFLGFLAGLGICHLLSKSGISTKAGWRRDNGHSAALIETRDNLSRHEITETLYSARIQLADIGKERSEEFNCFSFSAESHRELGLSALLTGEDLTWMSFVGAEAPVFNKKGERRFVRTKYYFISGQQTFPGIGRDVAEGVSLDQLEMLFDRQPGEMPLSNRSCLRFEPAEVEDHALRFINPSKDKGSSNVALNYLAMFALPLLCALPSPGFVKCLGNKPCSKKDEVELEWRLWDGLVRIETAISIQRLDPEAAKYEIRCFSARAVRAVRGQNYMRMLPSVRKW